MESYEPYSNSFRRLPDFRVEYQFLPTPDGSTRFIRQGSKLDFRYVNDGYLKNPIYIIWPEFEDGGSFTILDKWNPVEPEGTAKMWIVNQTLIEYHRVHIQVGTIGYMVGGGGNILIPEKAHVLRTLSFRVPRMGVL